MEIHGLLYRLGVTKNYKGFFQTAHAVELCRERPDRLLQVTKLVYPEVAKRYGTSWAAVERNIRTVGGIIWKSNRALLSELACVPLAQKPRPARLLAILAASVNEEGPEGGEDGPQVPRRAEGRGEAPERPGGEDGALPLGA